MFSNIASLHDNTKAGFIRELNSKLDVVKLQEVFEEFCFFTGNNEKLVLSRREAIEIIKKCIDSQGINTNPDDVLKDFSTVVCLLLKDGSEYSFIHRSIQEYFYSSFISNKSPIAKEKFYNKLLQNGNLYVKLRNVIDFLEKSDTYSYHKYFKLMIINNYINIFNVTEEGNTLLDNFYIQSKDNYLLGFRIIKQDLLTLYESSTSEFLHPLYMSIAENMRDKYSSGMVFGLSSTMENVEGRYVKIKDFGDDLLFKLVQDEALLAGRRLIVLKNEIIESIRKRDGIEFDFE